MTFSSAAISAADWYRSGRSRASAFSVARSSGSGTRRLNFDGGATSVVSATEVVAGPRRRTGVYVVLLLFLLALLALALYLLGRQAGVIGGSDGGSTTAVPNVVALEAKAAQLQLEQAGFTVKQDLQPNDATPKGNVFDQDPKANASAAKGSEVTIKVSSGSATVKVPTVVGKNLDDAIAELQAAGFNVAQPKLQNDEKRPEGIVLGQDPIGGNLKQQGSSVTLTVSTGKTKVTVPDEAGRDADGAEADLRAMGFTVARSPQPSDSVDQGTVISTDPAPNTQVDKGSKVTLVVSSGATTTTAPPTTTTTLRVTVTTARPTTTSTIGTNTTTTLFTTSTT